MVDLLAAPLVGALGEILLGSLWQGAIIALVLGAGLRLLRGAAVPVRYAAAYAALLLCPLLPVVSYAVSAGRLEAKSAPRPNTEADVTRSAVPPVPAALATVPADGAAQVKVQGGSSRTLSGPFRLDPRALVRDALPWAVLGWFAGVIWLALRLALGYGTVQRLRTRFLTPVPRAVAASFDRLRTRLGLSEQVGVAASRVADVPLVVGIARPLVLVPVALLAGLTPAQLEMLLAHELAHVRRRDPLANLVQAAVETLLFFNPAALWLSAVVRQERECCCDALAVTLCGGDKVNYAKTLATLNRLRGARNVRLAADGGSLLGRIRRLTGAPARGDLRPAHGLAGAALVVLPLVLASAVSAQSGGGTLRIAYSSIQQLDPYKSALGDEINAY